MHGRVRKIILPGGADADNNMNLPELARECDREVEHKAIGARPCRESTDGLSVGHAAALALVAQQLNFGSTSVEVIPPL